MNAAADDASVLVDQLGCLGSIRLNRPKQLNSLTLDMVRRISAALDHFQTDGSVAAVVICGAGDRGLCAGGDVRALYESGRAGTDLAATFWRQEYRLNARIRAYPKPYIAIMDGVTMGGGVGLSAHGAVRIVTERTRFAMPEVGIGFFPDVGSTWLLSRAPGQVGTYLSLTGEIINASDVIYAGLADFCVPSANIGGMLDTLRGLPAATDLGQFKNAVAPFSDTQEETAIQQNRPLIDRAFAADDVETIVAEIGRSHTAFADQARNAILAKSPTSLKLTLRLVRLALATRRFDECIAREYVAALRILQGHDFYEGIRAAVVDKDRNPRWHPDSLAAVSDQEIDKYLDATQSQAAFASDNG